MVLTVCGIAIGLEVLNSVFRVVKAAAKGYGVDSEQHPITVDLDIIYEAVNRFFQPKNNTVQAEALMTAKIIRLIWERTPDCHHLQVDRFGHVNIVTPRFRKVTVGHDMHFEVRLCEIGPYGFKNALPQGVTLEALITDDVINAMSAALMRDVWAQINDDGQSLHIHVSGEMKPKKNMLSTEKHNSEVGYVVGDDGELLPVDLFDDEQKDLRNE